MASGIQTGATHAKLEWSDCGEPAFAEWTGGVTLPVVDESCFNRGKAFIGFHPFASHLILASSWEDAYYIYVDAIADSISIDAETLKDYVVGHDEDGNPEYSEVEWTSGGEAVDTTHVSLTEIPTSGITWPYRPELVAARVGGGGGWHDQLPRLCPIRPLSGRRGCTWRSTAALAAGPLSWDRGCRPGCRCA